MRELHRAGPQPARERLAGAGLDDWAIEPCVVGVRRVLAGMGMVDPFEDEPPTPSIECRGSGWVRARRTGILRLDAHLGQQVVRGERLGALYDSFGKTLRAVYADRDGTLRLLSHRGEALAQIAPRLHLVAGGAPPSADPSMPEAAGRETASIR